MPKYLVQGSYTDQGLKGLLKEGGSKRRAMVEQLANEMGGKLEAFYYAFGSDDFVIILDLPSNMDMAATAIVAQASGMVKSRVTVLMTSGRCGPGRAKEGRFPPAGIADRAVRKSNGYAHAGYELDPGMTARAHHRSREACCPPRFACFPSRTPRERSADRRSGCIGTPSRASDAGPQAHCDDAPRVPSQTSLRSPRIGDARLSALHCGGLLASGPARDESKRAFTVCEFLASARSGGGRVSGASRVRGYEPARRTPHPVPTLARLRRRPR